MAASQALVEQHYGHRGMLPLLEALHAQTDAKAGAIIDMFMKDRGVEGRVSNLRAGMASPDTDAKALDRLNGELAAVLQRSELYGRYMRTQYDAAVTLSKATHGEEATGNPSPIIDLRAHMAPLISAFITLEEAALKESVGRAIAINSLEVPDDLTTTVVEDTFFVVSKSARRALSTLSADTVCVTLNNSRAVLEDQYLALFRAQVQTGLGKGGIADVLQGKFRTGLGLSSKLRAAAEQEDEDSATAQLEVVLNNVVTSRDYISKLMKSLEKESRAHFSTAPVTDRSKITSCIEDLGITANLFDNLAKEGAHQHCVAVTSGRVRKLVDEIPSYAIDESAMAGLSDGTPFVNDVINGISMICNQLRPRLVSELFDVFVGSMVDDLVRQLETGAMQTDFSRLGGVQFDIDLRVLLQFMTGIAQWTVREKFLRVNQIATLLSIERVSEVGEYIGPSSQMNWKLTPSEIKRILGCRNDFDKREIDRIVM